MNASPIEALGPPPFRFSPPASPSVEGHAFSPAFKLLATGLVFGTLGWLVHLWMSGKVVGGVASVYVRTLTGKFAVFYAADLRMISEFERLVVELRAFRAL